MTLRNLLLALIGAVLLNVPAQAQKIAFVNTKYILEQMPEYAAAQAELDRLSQQWQKEIDDRYEQIQRMRDSYNAEAILLTDEMKKSRQDEIAKKEREARELQAKRFGPKGDLFKKRQELIQPIQDRIYDAIKEVAGTTYLAIFDIGSESNTILFASEKYDKSDSVLRKLGIKPGKDNGSSGGAGADPEEQPEDGGEPEKGGTQGGGTEQPRGTDGGGTVKPK